LLVLLNASAASVKQQIKSRRHSVLKQRVITAVLLVAVLLSVLLLLPPLAAVSLFSLIIIAGAWEWAGFIRSESLAVRIAFTLLVAALLWFAYPFVLQVDLLRGVLLVALVWWLVALAWVCIAPLAVAPWSAALAGVLALVPAWMALVYLCLAVPNGRIWALFTLALTWAADTGAFFAGRFFGKTPLAPRVSPKKTWEGVLGGLLLSGAVGVLGAHLFAVPIGIFVGLCIAVAAISIVGDLAESMLKRAVGLKDSGWLFPGHGGVLDRIDSVTAAAPALLFGALVMGIVV
jgi:phosphatidate cytidylyltransferase